MLEIRKEHKDYGYRRILGELRNQGYSINKKKVQRIVQKLKVGSIVLIEVRLALLLRTGFADVLTHIYLIRKSLQIPANSSIMKLMRKGI